MPLEALKLEQKKIFEKLKNFTEFYLVGGTALALQVGHRKSVDFDLFSAEDIPSKLLDKVKIIFKDFNIKVVINHSEQLSIRINNAKIDFDSLHQLFDLKYYNHHSSSVVYTFTGVYLNNDHQKKRRIFCH